MFDMLHNTATPWQIDLLCMFALSVLVLQPISIALVRINWYKSHKLIQLGLSICLIPIFTLFEIYVRTTRWRELAEESDYYDLVVVPLLPIHMLFATICLLSWFFTVYEMLKNENSLATEKSIGNLATSRAPLCI